jgi:hypothetical protein
MTSSPDNTVENILDDLCKNTQVDYGYEKLVPSETIKAKQSLDSHYLNIFLEVVGPDAKWEDGMTDQAWYDIQEENEELARLRTALQDRLGEK